MAIVAGVCLLAIVRQHVFQALKLLAKAAETHGLSSVASLCW